MARIPDEEIERIKREVDLAVLVQESGVVLRRHGADLLGLCPFHDDREPSLVVTPEKNLWHCLGACRTGGSVIDWVMKRERVSFRHAVERLRSGAPLAPAPAAAMKRSRPVIQADAEDAALLRQVVSYYHEQLKQSPEAVAYLESRGLNHLELIERFRLGFANRTLGYHLPKKALKAGAEIRARLQRLGVLRESGHEHFNGSVVVPIFDSSGAEVGLYGRKITPRLREGTPNHLYLPGPRRGVWNREALQSPELILCESLFDALTFWAAGYRNVTTSYGVNGFTEELLQAMQSAGVRRVLIGYDRDEAGEKAAAALVPVLAAVGIASARIQFPRGLDANAYALQAQPAAKSLGLLIQNAALLAESGTADTLLPLAASPAAPSAPAPPTAPPASDAAVQLQGEEVLLTLGDRGYRVRGLAKNHSPDVMRINLLARRGELFHVDTLDLYQAKQRGAFAAQAARELAVKEEVLRKDLGAVLLKLEEIQAGAHRAADAAKAEAPIDEAEKAAALELLRSPDLLSRILADFRRCGTVGEETNKLVGYLAAVSRKLERPLAIIVQSSSAAGKTSLMDAVLSFVPPEEKVQYSALTGQSLFYMEGADLKHKVLAVVEEEGAEKASYALKLLQSEGELTIASTGKDPETGRLVTQEYRVEGPVMIFLTTTAVEIDEELLNRCLVLTVSEDREQTRAIHRIQRERRTLEGLLARAEREDVLALHRNAQRLLRPLAVVNPYAPSLTFLDSRTRTRRDHEKYLTLIDAIALLHQHQREVKTAECAGRRIEYIEATLSDIEHANRLADAVLGRSLDELPPQTRNLLHQLEAMIAEACERQQAARHEIRFSRKDVRHFTGWSDFQVRTHLGKLESLEYVLAHRGSQGQGYVYELLYSGEGDGRERFLMGLLDVGRLRGEYDPDFEGSTNDFEPRTEHFEIASRPDRAPLEPHLRTEKEAAKERSASRLGVRPAEQPKSAFRERPAVLASYVPAPPHANGNGAKA
jgi:DNA primase